MLVGEMTSSFPGHTRYCRVCGAWSWARLKENFGLTAACSFIGRFRSSHRAGACAPTTPWM
jgi:hypothetical protein